MAAIVAATDFPVAARPPRRRTWSPRAATLARRGGILVAGALWTVMPLLIVPELPSSHQLLSVLGAAAILGLIDVAATGLKCGWTQACTHLLLAGTAALIGGEVAALSLVFLPLAVAARAWSNRSSTLAALFAAAATLCRVDAGYLAAGQATAWPMLLAAAAFAGFATVADGRPARPVGALALAPARRGQVLEIALVALLAAGVAAGLAALGQADRVHELGALAACLPALILLLGAFRCAQLGLASGPSGPRCCLAGDAWVALAVTGWCASLAATAWFPAML